MLFNEQEITNHFLTFLLVLIRVSIIFAIIPFLGSRSVPAQFKIGLSVAVAFIITPMVRIPIEEAGYLPLYVTREMLFSATLALSIRFVFFAIDTAGQIISQAMGIAIAQVFNPELGHSTEIARLYGIIAMLVFLAIDAHHYFIYALMKSYEVLSPSTMNIGALVKEAVSLSSQIFKLSLKIAAPVIAIMMVTHILLGFISKLIPQFNVFFVGYPVYISVGFIIMLLGVPMLIHIMINHFTTLQSSLHTIIEAAGSR